MSVIKPRIDDLLDKTENNRFLLASLASKRACDINSMLRGQHSRVLAVQDVDDITIALSVDAASPNFAWNTPNEVVKRSMPIMVTVFGGMAAAFGGGFACWMLMDTLGAAAGDALNLGLGVACAAAGHLVFRRLCHRTVLFTR